MRIETRPSSSTGNMPCFRRSSNHNTRHEGGTSRLPPLASTTPRVFCFAASGTGPELFEKLAAHCGGRLELTCALLPGRHPRHKEDVVGDLGALAAALADYLPLEESLAPFALLGVSIGALVAWALAKDSVLWP